MAEPSSAPPAPEEKGESSKTPTPQKPISLNILNTVKTSQLQFGLRHADYQRYRKYCARRLMRLRKTLKFTHQTGSKGNSAFQKRPLEPDMVTDERHLLIALFRCERAWAYAMQLQQDMEIQTNNTRLIHHKMRRLDKAAKHAQVLEQISVKADETTAIEASAYAGYMQGIRALERELWDQAIKHLAKASVIYSKLATISNTETKQLCHEKVQEIEHRLRFCMQYLRKSKGQGATIGDQETKELIEKVMKGNDDLNTKLNAVTEKAAAAAVSSDAGEITWKGQGISLQNEKLRSALNNALKLERDVEDPQSNVETKLALFEQLFAAYADSTKIIKEDLAALLKSNPGKSRPPAVAVQEEKFNLLQEYVSYLKLAANVQRGILLADTASITATTDVSPVPATANKKKHPEDMVRLYENVLHGMSEMEGLRGPASDPKEQKLISAKRILYKAYRSYWLAQAFAGLLKMDEAVALFERSSQQAELAKSELETSQKGRPADMDRITRLEKDITASRAKSRARAFLANTESKQPAQAKPTSLAAGLNTFDASYLDAKRLVDFPPNLEATAIKPLLFDLALNDCAFPNLEARKNPKKGLWGFWR